MKVDNRNLALQTWTVRRQLRADARKALGRIRDIGFEYLEVANTGQTSAEEFYRLCRGYGLKIIGNHEPPLTSGNLNDLIEEIKVRCRIFQPRFVTVMLDPDYRGSEGSYSKYAELCAEAGEHLKQEGIMLCYHCYHYDMIPLGDPSDSKSGLDILLEETSADQLGIELDTYFLYKSGVAYQTIADKCGPRCKLVHLCDIDARGNRATLGEGLIHWSDLIEALQMGCSPQWLIIENDTDEPLVSIEQSHSYFRRILTPDK